MGTNVPKWQVGVCVSVCMWIKFVFVVFCYTASQAAAQARGRSGQESAAASSITGISLQEAQQILNISKLSPEEIQKVQSH